jgi:hypothetical protein
MHDKGHHIERRIEAAKALLPFCHTINIIKGASPNGSKAKAQTEKMVRLSEILASLAPNKDPKTLAIISQSFSEIEVRLARLRLNNLVVKIKRKSLPCSQ